MGCFTSHQLACTPEDGQRCVSEFRTKYGANVLIMSIKDQNTPGKVYFSGDASQALIDEFTKILQADPHNHGVIFRKDKYDTMYDVCWRNTSITTGHQLFSLTKSYFPRGTLFVKLLDCIAKHGWTLAAAPNFGGVDSRDDKGNVTSTVDWPIFIFYKNDAVKTPYNPTHLFIAVKDANIPGKVCAAGPVGKLETAMVSKLQQFDPSVCSEKDQYDDDFDVVWRNTSITSGASVMSFAKKYFPKSKVCSAMLECLYEHGWRVLACPNFGGQGDSWPCLVLGQVNDSSPPPQFVFASIKDSNQPGKLCMSGTGLSEVKDPLLLSLKQVDGNNSVSYEKDQYDGDHDEVMHNINITTGMAAFSLKLPYFPRCDSVMSILKTMQTEGYTLSGCPNFGGMLDSWPTFIFDKDGSASEFMYLAVKDDNWPGKMNLGGANIESNAQLVADLMKALQTLCGDDVSQTKDDYDKTFGISFKNVKITTGHAAFSMTKPYFPHGYVIDAVLTILLGHGWAAVGGPNFGDNGNTWPSIVFKKVSA